jgi:hypothetical protein
MSKRKVYTVESEIACLEILNKLHKKGLHRVVVKSGWQVSCTCGYSAVVAWGESTDCPNYSDDCDGRRTTKLAVKFKEIVASADKLDGCKCIKCRPELNAVLKLLPQPIYEEILEYFWK